LNSPDHNWFTKFFFYGNYFYGLCAVALSIEASIQQQTPLNSAWYYLAVFCCTVVYYTKAYITDSSGYSSDERNSWYGQNKTFIKWSQAFLFALAFAITAFFIYTHFSRIKDIVPFHLFLFVIFPFLGALYYGINSKINLRNVGWLKPFIIGFTWAGIVTFYPVLFYHIRFFHIGVYGVPEHPFAPITVISGLLFLKNFMFISVLCIMFDIKDVKHDTEKNLNTFIVKAGLRKTIFLIIIPLCLVGLGTFVMYGIHMHFHPIKITLNVLPFILLIITAYSLHVRRSLLYYLVVVDGLMLVKAICGTIAMLYF